MEPKGVIVTHENILAYLSAGDRPSRIRSSYPGFRSITIWD